MGSANLCSTNIRFPVADPDRTLHRLVVSNAVAIQRQLIEWVPRRSEGGMDVILTQLLPDHSGIYAARNPFA